MTDELKEAIEGVVEAMDIDARDFDDAAMNGVLREMSRYHATLVKAVRELQAEVERLNVEVTCLHAALSDECERGDWCSSELSKRDSLLQRAAKSIEFMRGYATGSGLNASAPATIESFRVTDAIATYEETKEGRDAER